VTRYAFLANACFWHWHVEEPDRPSHAGRDHIGHFNHNPAVVRLDHAILNWLPFVAVVRLAEGVPERDDLMKIAG
jgi:hypothetical protein